MATRSDSKRTGKLFMIDLRRFTLPLPVLLTALFTALLATGSFASPSEQGLIKVKNTLGMEFVKIPSGTFTMGSPTNEPGRDDDETQHPVTLTKSFYLQTTEVTQKQWTELLGGNPSAFQECGLDCPVDRVQYEWIEAYIKKLNELESGKKYRLPTEAEWEYAARAGSQTAFAMGACVTQQDAHLSGSQTIDGCPAFPNLTGPSPVARYAPNAWGLYDMHGNAWEMCSDWYSDYPDTAVTDPRGPHTGEHKVLRGGSWKFYPSFARSANRFKNIRDISGFRLVLELEE